MEKTEDPGSETPEIHSPAKTSHKDINTGKNKAPKKHYSEYLIQGLFIFASVSLGFLSQNIRERISNQDKEVQYISSYLRNLQVDSLELDSVIIKNKYKVVLLDSIIHLSINDLSEPVNRNPFYSYCLSIVSYYNVYRSNDATFTQLINADGLRTIKRDHVADSISKYASFVKLIYAAEDLYAHATDAATAMSHEVLDYSILYDSSYYKNHQLTGKYIPFNTSNPQTFKKFINKVYFERAATRNYVLHLESLKPFLFDLMAYLRQQYSESIH